MSLGNTNIHQRGEIPEITKLPNNRIRVVRRFHKFTREDVDNSNLGSLMGDFGDLDTVGEEIAEQGYTNCRLISVEVDNGYSSVANTDNAVLTKTYETLTDSFVQISDDTVSFTENGLKTITRVYRAISGTQSQNTVGQTQSETGEILSSSQTEDNGSFAELTEVYVEKGIINVQTPRTGGQQQVVVSTIGLNDSPDVKNAISAITGNHKLVDESIGNFEGYQTFNLTYEVDDFEVRSQSENGLQLLTRTELSTVNFSDGNVGVDTYKSLYLAGEDIDNGNAIKKRVSRWAEAGTISESINTSSDALPNTRTRSITSIGTEPTSNGILINKRKDNVDGFINYSYSFLETILGNDPTVGILQTYNDNIQVTKAGKISSQIINGVAELVIEPQRSGTVIARVDVQLTSDSSVQKPVAYNLDETSASATLTQTRITPIGVEQGDTLTVSVFNTRRTATVRPFPEHYYEATTNPLENTEIEPATILRDNDNIIGESLDETTITTVTLSGSDTEPPTTGIYDQKVEPAFMDQDGTQYYRKTTYTIE